MRNVPQHLGVAAVLVAATVLPLAPTCAQEPAGPYLGLGIGANWLQGLSATGPFGGETRLNYNVGPIGTAAAGYALGNGLRAEFEFGMRHSEAKNITIPSGATLPTGLDVKTNAQAYSYMVNGLYDFRLAPVWTANVGVGAGVANVRVNNVGHVSPFAYQFMTGVEYGLAPQAKLGLEYKFLGTDSLKFKSNSFFTSHPNYYDHAVLVTFRYTFGAFGAAAAAAPAAAAVYTPPPAPSEPAAGTTAAPPPFSRDFNVYFATNSAALTSSAREVVREAATAAQQNAPARINVSGHTDTAGPAGYNQQLSNRRAEAVRSELVANGVAPDEIDTSGRGENDLAVQTADSVNEPRNRRVVIVVQGPGT